MQVVLDGVLILIVPIDNRFQEQEIRMGFHVPPLLSYQSCLALDLCLPGVFIAAHLKPRCPSHHRVPQIKGRSNHVTLNTRIAQLNIAVRTLFTDALFKSLRVDNHL